MSLPLTSDDMSEQPTPWYIKFLYTFGIPAALTVYLVYVLVSSIDAKLNLINNVLLQHQIDMANSLRTNDELKQQAFATNLILQRICVNTAANQAARNSCFGGTP